MKGPSRLHPVQRKHEVKTFIFNIQSPSHPEPPRTSSVSTPPSLHHPSVLIDVLSDFYALHRIRSSKNWPCSIYLMLTNPRSSPFALAWAMGTASFTIATAFFVIFSSLLSIRENETMLQQAETAQYIIDILASALCTLDYFTRLYCCVHFVRRQAKHYRSFLLPSPRVSVSWIVVWFVTDFFNLIDLVSVLPFWVLLGVKTGTAYWSVCLRIGRLARSLNVIKFAKFHETLLVFKRAMSQSKDAFLVMFFFLILSFMVFGVIIYECEKGELDVASGKYMRVAPGGSLEESPFGSMLDAVYYVAETLSTVGFGEMVAYSPAGKFVSVIMMFFGALFISCPITIISTHFHEEYKALQERKVGTKPDKLQHNASRDTFPQAISIDLHPNMVREMRPKTRTAETNQELQLSIEAFSSCLDISLSLLQRHGREELRYFETEKVVKSMKSLNAFFSSVNSVRDTVEYEPVGTVAR